MCMCVRACVCVSVTFYLAISEAIYDSKFCK